jgi:PAS domain-containing protein
VEDDELSFSINVMSDVFATEDRSIGTRARGGRRRPSGIAAAWSRPEPAIHAVLDKLNRGVILIDRERRVHFANRAAFEMLGRRDCFTIEDGRLRFCHAQIDGAIAALIMAGNGSCVLRAPRFMPDGDYRVLVSALDGQEAEGMFCLFIYEPLGGLQPLPLAVLRDLYGLTEAEARLANALFVRKSLKSAAAELGISLHTAKGSLKAVFHKCEVRSQGSLVQLLALGPRTL